MCNHIFQITLEDLRDLFCYLKLYPEINKQTPILPTLPTKGPISITLLSDSLGLWIFISMVSSPQTISYDEILQIILKNNGTYTYPHIMSPNDTNNDSFSWQYVTIPIKAYGHCAICGKT